MTSRIDGGDLWTRRGKVVGEHEVAEQDVLVLAGGVQQVERKVLPPDGCPELDNDKDGLLDTVDACPNEAGPPESTMPLGPIARASAALRS